MLEFFIKRPVTTIMFIMFWVALGIVSYPRMNIEADPAIDFPMVTATFVYPGAEPAEIESQVIKKAEDAMSEVAGLKKITSSAFENGGFVMAEFNIGVNVNDTATEIKTKLDSIISEFPDDMELPVVEKLNPLEESVIDIALTGASLRDLQQYVDDTLSNKLTGISGVASVEVFGGEERAIRIDMDPEQLAARGVAVMDIVSALGNNNLNVPGGKIESDVNSSNVRFMGEFESVQDINDMRITTMEGNNFPLFDIAWIRDAARDVETGARFQGDKVVIVSLIKATDGNAVKISESLHKKLPELTTDLKNNFPNASMQVISDSSISIIDETNSTLFGIFLGLLFTVIILFVFTKNIRSTIVAAVVIPASMVAGFFFMEMAGFTVNSMTLLAMSSVLGTLISNAIILIESALKELGKGKNQIDAAIDGTKNVTVPILAGVGTNVVVFLPLAFMGGIAGQFMIQFGLTIVYVTLLSLMFSFTLTPMMIAKLLKPSKSKPVKVKKIEAENQMPKYRKWFDFQYRKSGTVILMALGIFVGSIMLMKYVGNEFSPSSDIGEVNMMVRTPMGSTFAKSENVAKQIEDIAKQLPEVKDISVKIGNQGLQNIEVKINLVDVSDRNISDKDFAQKILPLFANIPDAEIQIKGGEAAGGGGLEDLVLNVSGNSDELRMKYALALIDVINELPEVQSAFIEQQTPPLETRFIPDSENMSFWGVNNAYAGATLRTALFGNDEYKYKEDGDEFPIILSIAEPFQTENMFDLIYVNSNKGLVSMSKLGDVEKVPASSNISRIDKNRITEININIGKSTIGPVQAKIQERIDEMNWEFGYGATFGGMSETQEETNQEMASTFLLAVILTFMLLAAILNSWVHPFTIATSIFTSFAGVFTMLFLTGATVNIAALLAIIMLVGLVVNNNILILEPTVNKIRDGMDAKTALWEEIVDKKSMILMTSIAIIAGMLPQMFGSDGMKVSMAAVIIGGMIASLIWTFVLTPALFFGLERLRTKFVKKQ